MRSLFSMIAGCMALLAMSAAGPARAQVTVIHAGSVIRDADGEPSGPATITIEDGRIVSIVDGLQTPGGEAQVIDLADKTVLPGLIDLHVHLTGDPGGDFWKEATEPGEWRLINKLTHAPIPTRLLSDDRFIASRKRFEDWAEGRKALRMEYFYREMRRETGLLMEGDDPAGGKWNFDHDNRKPPKEGLEFPQPLSFAPDAETQAGLDLGEPR